MNNLITNKYILFKMQAEEKEITIPILDLLTKKLYIERTKEGFLRRKELFQKFDKNNNGFISYIEALHGVKETLNFSELGECKPVIYRAFVAARNSQKNKAKLSNDFIELNEFRYFLCYIRQYYEYYEMFSCINTDGNSSISYEEFRNAIPNLQKWGVKIYDADKVFKEIDLDHSKTIKFDEFCSWAIKKKLELEGDDFYDECLKNLK